MSTDSSRGLHAPGFEHDSCGFGLIADLDDRASRTLVDAALTALSRLAHRGAVGADGLSGDGCGLLLHRPEVFLRTIAAEAGFAPGERFAAGMLFLPHGAEAAAHCRAQVAQALTTQGLGVAGWREVPVDRSACGTIALAGLPRIEQVFVDAAPAEASADFQRALFLARRAAERTLADEPGFYVVTLSATTIGYKAMVLPDALARVYPDLARPELASSVVMFHQRFSTNTAPAWKLAQPFRLLAHNGEINTIEGNRHWSLARGARWSSPRLDFRQLQPLVSLDGSDSQSLDNMLETLLVGGMDLLQAMRILIPPATASLEYIDPDLAAFYEYYGLSLDPWDGPAGIVMCDGRYAACTLDRNGLRPARWLLTDSRQLVVASEAGVFDCAPERIVAKGKLGPGEMLAVDLQHGRLLHSGDIDAINTARAPFKRWLKQGVTYLVADLIDPSLAAEPFDAATLRRFQKLFQLTREERESVLRVLAETEQEATGSMGDDTPFAVLSQHVRPLYDYFRQAFAQVTNPPIDPLREQVVMSLATQIGREGNVFELTPANARQVMLNSPVLSQRKLRQLLSLPDFVEAHARVDLYLLADETLQAGLLRLCAQAEAQVRAGAVLLLLSDRFPEDGAVPIHALLATGAIHHHLVRAGLRCDCNLIIETGSARDAHQLACLIGCGATAIYPYLAYQTLAALGRGGALEGKSGNEAAELGRSYRRGLKKGLLKILSKMGISTIGSYRGAQLFEIVGLAQEVVALCFPGIPSRVQGAGFAQLEHDSRQLAARAWCEAEDIEVGGRLKYVHGGETHMYNPDVIASLQLAVRSGEFADYEKYARHVDGRAPATLRDLLRLREGLAPIPVEAVESVEAILARFDSAGMSLGALSPEAHEALATAMNRLGARSNSGEGGEDPARHGSERRRRSSRWLQDALASRPNTWSMPKYCRSRSRRAPSPARVASCPGTRSTS